MAQQNYGTVQSRNLIRAALDMLAHAEPITVLGDFGAQKTMPMNQTDTIVFRRTLPFGASTAGTTVEGSQRYVGSPTINPGDLALAEGVTPNAQTISFQDVSVTLQNWGILYQYSSKVAMMYEDDVPNEMVAQTGETLGEMLEIIRYGVLKAGSTVVYAGSGSSRATVATPISLNALRKCSRTLESNRAKKVTTRVNPGPNFSTRAVQPSFLVFIHTDAAADVRNLPGFTRVEEYGSFKPVHDREIGACEEFRFITSPLFLPFLAAGAAVAGTGMLSVGGANCDIYPCLVVGQDAWASVALKGKSAITPVHLRPSDINHANPLGMFGFVGANLWFNAVRLNEAWMARLEVAVTNLV